MPTLFKMVATDAVLQTYLTLAERNSIRPVQRGSDWNFEFHGGHETGSPFYIRPDGCNVKSRLSKYDTHTLDGTRLAYAQGNMSNPEHVAAMTKTNRDHLYEVVSGNWLLLAAVSRRFPAGDRNGDVERAALAEEEARRRAAALAAQAAPKTKPCTSAGCQGNVPIVTSGKAPCDTCWQFQ